MKGLREGGRGGLCMDGWMTKCRSLCGLQVYFKLHFHHTETSHRPQVFEGPEIAYCISQFILHIKG